MHSARARAARSLSVNRAVSRQAGRTASRWWLSPASTSVPHVHVEAIGAAVDLRDPHVEQFNGLAVNPGRLGGFAYFQPQAVQRPPDRGVLLVEEDVLSVAVALKAVLLASATPSAGPTLP